MQIQQRRQELELTQDELAKQAETSRTTVALLEQGRRVPASTVLDRILTTLELAESHLASFGSPDEQLRLQFEQALSELVGRAISLQHHDDETVEVAREMVNRLFQADKTLEQGYDAFCTALVFYGVARPSVRFFNHYIGTRGTSSIAGLEKQLEAFHRDAIRLFPTFGSAYTAMALTDRLDAILSELQPKSDTPFRAREAWSVIEIIAPERLADLGYISAANIRKEQGNRQILSSFLSTLADEIDAGDKRAVEKYSAKKRRKMGSLLRELKGRVEHDFLSPLFAPDPDLLRREAARVAPKGEAELLRIGETQAMGQRNLARYLSADHLDVYVATSMRTESDFLSVNAFVESLFSTDEVRPLRLRYFNPTQSWIEDRVAKGLVEALMLRRSRLTIYMAQKEDTFGKDSEASVALGQGKPVIVYVPRLYVPSIGLDSSEIGTLEDAALLQRIQQNVDPQEVDDTADRQALIAQLVMALLDKADDETLSQAAQAHLADFDLVGEGARRVPDELKKEYAAWVNEMLNAREARPIPAALRTPLVSILTALATDFEKRAHVFREIHPLALQVILSTGVLNGILVVRSVDACAGLLASVVRNELAFELASDENNYRLIEATTRSTVRVISRNQLIVNAFAGT